MSATEIALAAPEVEVVAKASRRRFTVEYKRKNLREADGCKTAGAVGALLRREGLYSSHLTTWRAARDRGELAGTTKKRGPVARRRDPRDKDVHYGLAEQRVAARAVVLAEAYAAHPERFPAGLPHPPARPVEVWITPPKTRATEEARGLAPTRGGVLDHARPGQLLSAHRSDLHRRGCLEAPA